MAKLHHTQEATAFQALAVSSWSWHDTYYAGSWSLLNLPVDAAATGISAIECNDFMLPPPRRSRIRRPLFALLPGAPPELWRYSRATLQSLSAKAADSGVHILTWTINSDFTVSKWHWPAQQLYLRRGVAAARRLQTPLLRVNLGGTPETPLARDEAVIRRLYEFVASSQKRYPGVMVTLENHWGISTDIDRHLHIFDQVAAQLSPSYRARFGCCFDPDNVPQHSERERWWQELASRANHFHLKTKVFDDNGVENTLPHAHLFELLQSAEYQGWVTIEYAGDGNASEGVSRSAQLFTELGVPVLSSGSPGLTEDNHT